MELEQVQRGSQDLASLVGLRGEMVAVRYFEELPTSAALSGEVVACQAIQDARFGQAQWLSKENSKCLGATYFLGFEPFSPLAYDFWVNNEQSMCDRAAAENMVRSLPAPPNSYGQYVLFAPLAAMSVEPDLVLVVCNAEQLSRILGLHIFKTGDPAMVYSYGATCQSAVGIPLTTDKLNVSFVDWPSRLIAHFDPSEQIVSIPYSQMADILGSMGDSINGMAQPRFSRKGLPYLQGDWRLPSGTSEEEGTDE